jgi:hypothetical protein
MNEDGYKKLNDRHDEVNAMLYSLTNNWRNFSNL